VGDATSVPNGTKVMDLVVLDDLRRCVRDGADQAHASELRQKRRAELRQKVQTEGLKGTIYVWKDGEGRNVILDGIETYEVAKELGLEPGVHYQPEFISKRNGKPIKTLQDAKRWRFERNVSTRKSIPTWIRGAEAIELFRDEMNELKKIARQNQKSGKRINGCDKIDTAQILAGKAGISRRSVQRVLTVYNEMKRDPHAPDERKRQYISAEDIIRKLHMTETGDKSIKNVCEDIKNERQRKRRKDRNGKNAPTAAASFVCDTDFDSTKDSQIIHGDSLALLQSWAALPVVARPRVDAIFGSPPYWIEASTRLKHGAGKIRYGDAVEAFFESHGIHTWDDYVQKFVKPYLEAALELLPSGGRFLWQVDNTRCKVNGNLIRRWHDVAITCLAEEMGWLVTDRIVWFKNEIAGRRQGFGTANKPSIRPNEEYIVVLRKDSCGIEGEFDSQSDWHDRCLSTWSEAAEAELTEAEKIRFSDTIWRTNTARNKDHPAVFPLELAIGAVKLFCPLGGVVLDPWNGTGTTCEAAYLSGRRFIGIDIEEGNCELALERLREAEKKLGRIEAAAEKALLNEMPRK